MKNKADGYGKNEEAPRRVNKHRLQFLTERRSASGTTLGEIVYCITMSKDMNGGTGRGIRVQMLDELKGERRCGMMKEDANDGARLRRTTSNYLLNGRTANNNKIPICKNVVILPVNKGYVCIFRYS